MSKKNWCAAEDVDMTILADDGTFGKAYGLILNGGPLEGRLARSVFVIKKMGKLSIVKFCQSFLMNQIMKKH